MRQLRRNIILLLTFAYFNTILYEIFLNSLRTSSSSKRTLLEHIQLPFTLPPLIDGISQRLIFFIFFILLIILLMTVYHHQILIFYVAIFKILELISLLIDLINLLFIYQYKMKDIPQQNLPNHLHFSLTFSMIRLAINLDTVRRKCNCREKRQMIVLFDLALFILVNVILMRYSYTNFIRIGRKLILGLLIFQLNHLLWNDNFWIAFNRSNDYSRNYLNRIVPSWCNILASNRMEIVDPILSICWTLSLFIIGLFIFFTLPSIIIDENGSLFTINHMQISFKAHQFDVGICIISLWVINWNTVQSRETFKRYGIDCFSIGYNVLPKRIKLTKVSLNSDIKPTTTFDRSTAIPTQQPDQTYSTKKKGVSYGFFDLFYSLINAASTSTTKVVSLPIGKGIIEVEKGDITEQTVDVIIGSSSSENLRQILLRAAGNEVEQAYTKEYENNPNSLIISVPSGHLPCKRIFFLKWDPQKDQEILQQSIADLISNVIQNVLLHKYTSIAFPAIGCGGHACSVDLVVKTMVREMKQQIHKRKLPWTVKFIIQHNQQNVYDEFCKQLLSSDHISSHYQIPSTWINCNDNQLRHLVHKSTNEYTRTINSFDAAMKGKYTQIIKLERIQNERWYMQYMAHSKDFKKRLNEDTEKRLYHGCPDKAANSIIHDCFNRSFAGVNGVLYGVGVYFSANVGYSHNYTKPNANGERCIFIARVLVGKTTKGNSSMKTRPLGFDSTTDGEHITVIYHDAQAYAEYLITYK